MVQATVALRVDVDTRRGLAEGVPRLLEFFRRAGIRASFFVTMGPDRSGLAIRRALQPSFLFKMWRTNPLKLYGLRTLLSGTLLPALPVGADLSDPATERYWIDWTPFSYPFNMTRQPAATVPCGLTKSGLPIGLQIVGRLYEESTVLRAAGAYEATQTAQWPALD